MNMFAGGDSNFRDLAADAGVAEDVVGTSRLFHPPGRKFRELAGADDGFEDAPLLVGVDHELVRPADLFADDMTTAKIVGCIPSYLQLEVGPAFGQCLSRKAAYLFFAVTEPACRGGVGGVALLFE